MWHVDVKALCFVALLQSVVVQGIENSCLPSCDGHPPDGVWLLTTYVTLPDSDGQETVAATSVIRLIRETESYGYRGEF